MRKRNGSVLAGMLFLSGGLFAAYADQDDRVGTYGCIAHRVAGLQDQESGDSLNTGCWAFSICVNKVTDGPSPFDIPPKKISEDDKQGIGCHGDRAEKRPVVYGLR